MDLNKRLIFKFLKRNGIDPSFKTVDSLYYAIEEQYDILSKRIPRRQKKLIPNELSLSNVYREAILEAVPSLADLSLEEQQWIIKKIASRLYDEKEY